MDTGRNEGTEGGRDPDESPSGTPGHPIGAGDEGAAPKPRATPEKHTSAEEGAAPPSRHNPTERSARSSADFERDLVRTRHEMDETLGEIQQRLHPEHLRRQAQDAARRTVRETAQSARRTIETSAQKSSNRMFETIKENPLPTALVGIGLSWLFARGARTSGRHRRSHGEAYRPAGYYGQHDYVPGEPGGQYEYARPPREQAMRERMEQEGEHGRRSAAAGYSAGASASEEKSSVGERVGEAAGEAKSQARQAGRQARKAAREAGQAASQAGHQARRTAEQAGHQVSRAASQAGRSAQQAGRQVQHQAERLETKLKYWAQENPLAVGAATLALGAFTGLIIPRTHREDEMMGRTRDRAVHQAQDYVQEAAQRGERVVEKTFQETKKAAVETTKEEIQHQKEEAKAEHSSSS